MGFLGQTPISLIRSKKILISDIYQLISCVYIYIYIYKYIYIYISAECGYQVLVTKTFNGGRIT